MKSKKEKEMERDLKKAGFKPYPVSGLIISKKGYERLRKPLFKKGKKTMTKGGKLKVSAEKGIKGLLGTI